MGDNTNLSGIVMDVTKSTLNNDISIKSECTRKNSPGITNKIPDCEIIIPESIDIRGELINNPTTCTNTPDGGWIIKFMSSVIINGKIEICYIEFKTYDISSAINNSNSDAKQFPYIGRYWDLIQYINNIKNVKLLRIQHAYTFCPNNYGILLLNNISMNWNNIDEEMSSNISKMIEFLDTTKYHLSIEIYPTTGQAGILTNRHQNIDKPQQWSDIFGEEIPSNPSEAKQILDENIQGFSGMEGEVVLQKGRILSNFIKNLDYLHNLGIVIKDLHYRSVLFEGDGNVIFTDLQNSILESGNNWSRNINHLQSMNPEKTNMLTWYKIGKKMNYPPYDLTQSTYSIRKNPEHQGIIDSNLPVKLLNDHPQMPMLLEDSPSLESDLPVDIHYVDEDLQEEILEDNQGEEPDIGQAPVNLSNDLDKFQEIQSLIMNKDIYDGDGNISRSKLIEFLTNTNAKKNMDKDDPVLTRLIELGQKYQRFLKLTNDDNYVTRKMITKDDNIKSKISDIEHGLKNCGANSEKKITESECSEFIKALESIRSGSDIKKTKKKKKKKKKKNKKKTEKKPKKNKKATKKKHSQKGG